MKILVCGHARHGKDTFADYISELTGLKTISSSLFGLRYVVYPELKEKFGYKSEEECYEDRVNHRKLWYDMLCDYNKDDQSRLATNILKEHDIYVGMRSGVEFEASKHLFDYIIWVDGSGRLPLESSESNTINESGATHTIYNNGTLKEFKKAMNNFILKDLNLPWYKKLQVRFKLLFRK